MKSFFEDLWEFLRVCLIFTIGSSVAVAVPVLIIFLILLLAGVVSGDDNIHDFHDPASNAVRRAIRKGLEWDIPPVYQWRSEGVAPVGHNPSQVHRFGTPNNHHPWLHPAGFDNVEGVSFRRFLWLPDGKKIRLYMGRVNAPGLNGGGWETVKWEYPAGAVRVEVAEVAEKPILIRARIHDGTSDEETRQYQLVRQMPAGYVEPDNCTNCHEDEGVHAMFLSPARS